MIKNPNIFFGKAVDFPVSFKDTPAYTVFLEQLAEKLNIQQLTISYQTHSIKGRRVTKQPQIRPVLVDYKSHDGDYLITSDRGLAIAVHTADCLPLIFYAPDKQVIAAAHAGWKGSVAGIGAVVIEHLIRDFGIDIKQLKIWFGPAGGACCYEVKYDFIEALNRSPFVLWARPSTTSGEAVAEEQDPAHGELVEPRPEGVEKRGLIEKRAGKMFFNNGELNRQQLMAAGVDESNIDRSNNHCTICNHEYHSYRRATDKTQYFTQATIVWMK
ncbi:laccase domain-containing protein [Candidatus Dependentiae bacterium]|nr:laccase domain-containing protein [Candidatus Dependentiae bacterium]